MPEISPEILGLLAVVIDVAATVVYIRKILRKEIKPHPYTWLIWALMTGVIATMQVYGGGGPGAWLLVGTTILNIIVFVLSLYYGTKDIQPNDRRSLFFCLMCFVLYFIFQAPIITAMVATLIDIVSFFPTMRKSWAKPEEESASLQFFLVISYTLSLVAMEQYSITTSLYPVGALTMHVLTCSLILYRRSSLHMGFNIIKRRLPAVE